MKKPVLACVLQIIFICAFAQLKEPAIYLKTGKVSFSSILSKASIDSFNASIPVNLTKSIILLRFQMIPGDNIRKSLADKDIILLDYLGYNIYMASVSGRLSWEQLQSAGIVSFQPWLPGFKTDPLLEAGKVPAHAKKVPGMIDVQVYIPKSFSVSESESVLSANHFDIINTDWAAFGKLTLRIAQNQLRELASFPFIQYIEPVAPDPVPLNNRSRDLTNASILSRSIAEGGKGLNGEGVAIGIGDAGDMQIHIDFAGRLISRTTLSDNHGILVGGTAAGGGIVYELFRGFASKAKVISESQANVLVRTPFHFRDFGMVVTNNSYGIAQGCDYTTMYDLNANNVDQLSLSIPEVLHVFASGNNGVLTCVRYPTGFNTLSPGFQCAKNVLTVGATNDTAEQAIFTGRGPTTDGRIKPEITAMGVGPISTSAANSYAGISGTSIAAPAVTGGAALLYQRYRQLHTNNYPKNGLIKALLCNGADDKGVPGPDYTYGFGSMNLLRSVDMIEQDHYFVSTLSNGTNNSYTITIPANTAQVKVMLYWNDPAALPITSHQLVNDLDAELVTPGNTTIYPLVPDTLPANVGNVATNKADHINNIEQIVIDHPAAGNYTVRVKGTAIPQGPQEYFLVYDFIPVSLNVTNPAGADAIVPGENVKIRWDAYGNPGNGFTLEYSIDNGTNWLALANNISPVSRAWFWQVPNNLVSADARIRVTQNGTGLSAISQRFTIIGLPVITLDPVQCDGSVVIQWNSIAGATDYELMMLRGDEMRSVGTTTNTNWHFNGLSADSVYWVTVRARINGRNGRRAIAISRQPNTGDCSSSFFDNDLKLDTVLSPVTGRKFTSTALSATQVIKVRIKNHDNAPVNGFTAQYSLDGINWHTETVNATIAAGANYVHVFTQTADMSAVGSYTLYTVVKNLVTDPIARNDTSRMIVRHLDNQPISLSITNSFLDDLEASPDTTYSGRTRGLTGIDRYDFENALITGQVCTFVNSDVAYSGRNSFVMGDRIIRTSALPNVLYGTYNLAGKSVSINDIRLSFQYIMYTLGFNNDVSVRGSDTDPWIKVFDFNTNLSLRYRTCGVIEISDSLAKYGQQFSSSFQVRWREAGIFPRHPGNRMFSVDDIRLLEVNNDMQMKSIDNPTAVTCGLNATAPVVISIHNSHNAALTNIPVMYSFNNGPWVTETIPSLAANTKLQYQFTRSIDLGTPGSNSIRVVVAYPGDTYNLNDTISLTFNNTTLVSTYPHLQDFESGNGGWYTEGTNSSWEYGVPSSPSVKKAASGTKVWKTKLNGHYNTSENSFLYSPCYQLSGMTKPALSFSMAYELDSVPNTFDFARVEYSVNGAANWTMLDQAAVINWYPRLGVWGDSTHLAWHVATTILPVTTGTIRFRFLLSSDYIYEAEGLAIDDIHVYDDVKGIYDGPTMTSAVSKSVSGDQWIDFESNGKLIASINPGGQDLGMTDIQAYINAGAVRHTDNKYYHDRNLTIRPANKPADWVTVRFYYMDAETESLLTASGCVQCIKPASAYVQGISQYSNTNRTVENGTMDDNNIHGSWSYIPPSAVRHVPFDKGYYAEFKVKSFSELWLNSGEQDIEALIGKVYPNPSAGKFNLVFQLPAGEKINARVINLSGQVIRNYQVTATGYTQTVVVDLSAAADGMYLLQFDNAEKKQRFKLIKSN